jgi:hypothetical protein
MKYLRGISDAAYRSLKISSLGQNRISANSQGKALVLSRLTAGKLVWWRQNAAHCAFKTACSDFP